MLFLGNGARGSPLSIINPRQVEDCSNCIVSLTCDLHKYLPFAACLMNTLTFYMDLSVEIHISSYASIAALCRKQTIPVSNTDFMLPSYKLQVIDITDEL